MRLLALISIAQMDAAAPVDLGTWFMLTAGMLLMGMSILRSRRAGRQAALNAKNSGNAASRTMR